jgi:hypothetical protein
MLFCKFLLQFLKICSNRSVLPSMISIQNSIYGKTLRFSKQTCPE